MPSRRSQICSITARFESSTTNPGRTSRARCANSSNAAVATASGCTCQIALIGHAQPQPARRQHPNAGSGTNNPPDEVTHVVDEVLAVVDDDQGVPRRQPRQEVVIRITVHRGGQTDSGDERIGQQDRLGDRDQVDEPDAVVEPIREVRRDLDRQPGLADPAEARATRRDVSSTTIHRSRGSRRFDRRTTTAASAGCPSDRLSGPTIRARASRVRRSRR